MNPGSYKMAKSKFGEITPSKGSNFGSDYSNLSGQSLQSYNLKLSHQSKKFGYVWFRILIIQNKLINHLLKIIESFRYLFSSSKLKNFSSFLSVYGD